MADHKKFKAFFSYAHHDADTDRPLVLWLTDELEKRVNAKLANARFEIWRDKQGLRAGDRWNPRLEDEVRSADVLIVMLTPRWVESDYCRKEYDIFEEAEVARGVGDYVVPILARPIEQQEKHLTPEQNDVYGRIRERQYAKAIAKDFVRLGEGEKVELIEKIADDILGMIERLRMPPSPSKANRPPVRSRHRKEFDSNAQNYERVDFVRHGEVVLDR